MLVSYLLAWFYINRHLRGFKMRKQLHSALIASAALMMLTIPPSWAQQGYCNNDKSTPGQDKKTCSNGAPEIDVGAGGAGLTVLAIALLLASERRSRGS